MNRAWQYCVWLGRWRDMNSGEMGFPVKGDWYSDAGDWRIW